MNKQEIYDSMVKCSGPHKEVENNTNRIRDGKDLYSSFHWDEFNFTNSLRNTLTRFDEFGISNLKGKTVLDLGSNIGGISFEALRRDAKSVIGVEFVKERVEVCRELAKFLGKQNKTVFIQADLNAILNLNHKDFLLHPLSSFDVVFCTSIDAYIGSKYKLYQFLFEVTNEVCYFETNSAQSTKELTDIFLDIGFAEVTCLGTSKSDPGFGRCSFILRKASEVKRIRDIICEEYSHRTFFTNSHFINMYKNPLIYNKMKHLCRRLKHVPYVIPMSFEDNLIVKTPKFGLSLFDLKNQLSVPDKIRIKEQIILFMKALQYVNLAHMDIHTKNVLYDGNQIRIIDWEFVEMSDAPIYKHYDLTGTGIDNGFPSSLGQHILRKGDSFSIYEFLKPVDLTLDDFTK